MKTIYCYACLLLPLFLSAQDTIPFQLNSAGNIVLSVLLNETDSAQLMLHTAASDVSLIQASSPLLPSVQFLRKDSITSWGGDSETRFSTGNNLRIGQQSYSNLTIWENLHSGPETDGKLGLHLFAGKVVAIYFSPQYIVLYDSLPELPESYEAIALNRTGDFLTIEGALTVGADTLRQEFLIHSGYAGAMLLDDAFVDAHTLGQRLPIISEEILRDAYGHEIKSQQVALPSFLLGDVVLHQLPAAFFSGNIGRHKVSLLGMGLIQQFNWVFDVQHQVVYLTRV